MSPLNDVSPSNASELSAYVESLREHLLTHPDEWAHVSLEQFHTVLAELLHAASIYE